METNIDTIEEAVLGSVLIDPDKFRGLNDILDPGDFRWHPHQWAWEAMRNLSERGEAIDFLSVSQELNVMGKLDEYKAVHSGFTQYAGVSNLINATPTSLHAETYARQRKAASATRKISALMQDGAVMATTRPPLEVLTFLEGKLGQISTFSGARSHSILTADEAARAAMEASERAANNQGIAISTGYPDLDRRLNGGFYPEDLIIIAARPGEGKTALLLSLAANIAIKNGVKMAVFSLEMPATQVVDRIISQMTGIPVGSIRNGRINGEDQWNLYYDAVGKIAASELMIDDSPTLSIPELRQKVRRLVEQGVKVIGVDQLSFISAEMDPRTPEHVRLNAVAHGLKTIAREFGVVVILNHQMNRGTEGRGSFEDPTLADLEQAGDKPASVVLFIRHKREGEVYQATWLYIAKNRDGAAGVRVSMVFLAERTRFESSVRV